MSGIVGFKQPYNPEYAIVNAENQLSSSGYFVTDNPYAKIEYIKDNQDYLGIADDEFNSLYELVREKYSGERRSIAQDMLKELPQYMKTGVVSSMLKLNMKGKFSSATMVPDTLAQAAFPHLSGAGTIAADAYKAATDPTATNLSNLAVSATPSGFKQGMNALVNKEDNWLVDRRGESGVERTPEEWKYSIVTGLVPLKEATDKTGIVPVKA